MATTQVMPRSVYAGKLAEFPDFAFAGAAALGLRSKWRDFFESRMGSAFEGRIVLEIGCASAAFLSRIAAEHPNIGFVGIDWKCKAIYDGAKAVTDQGLHNVALLRARGHDLPLIFGDAELDQIWIFHPDPCDGKRELKNRLISARFLKHAHSVLRDRTSLLALKTDHEGYYQSVIDLLEPDNSEEANTAGELTQRFAVGITSTDYWHDPLALARTAERLFAGKRTLFENRFIKKRVPIRYVELRKKEPL
jgi:tRNA (guanine-N(7)-)-methyltransferase